jgi:pyocin large subunit-like protein
MDFNSKNPDHYAAQAWEFLQRAKKNLLLMKWSDSDQTLRVFDPKTRAFAAYNRNGTTKTYFRPQSSTYWDRQPGHLIQAKDLPF